MTNDTELEVFRALRETQNRYTYFLLATAGAAIALAINQTRDVPLALFQIPLALAVVCWGLSFFFGCRNLAYVSSSLYANAELFRVQRGEHPLIGHHPDKIAAGSEGIREAIEYNSHWANRFGHWQFRFLVAGAVFYIAWHVLEMFLRSV